MRSTAVSGAGTYSPFEQGPNLIGRPGSSSTLIRYPVYEESQRRSPQGARNGRGGRSARPPRRPRGAPYGKPPIDPEERDARSHEDHRDAETFRLLFYTGLRLGEVLTLRWEDVDLQDRLLLVRRGLSAGQETLPKVRRHWFVPPSAPAGQHIAPMADELPYAISKGAVHQMTRSLADALADRGITVNTVNPGPCDHRHA